MATWMTHLRIGKFVFEAIDEPGLDPLSFAFGSVAPDCGIAPAGRALRSFEGNDALRAFR